MDFLDPKKKRAHSIRLFVGYILIAIALALSTFLLVLMTSGYGFNSKTGQVVKNGLVFIDSHPVGSNIFINGKEKGSTDGRFVLEEGSYTILLRREGYRDWAHDLDLAGASIEQLIYPFLFPVNISSRDVALYSTPPDMVSQSADQRWIISHNPSAPQTFGVIDASSRENATALISVSTEVLPSRPGLKLQAVEWSDDNKHLLIKAIADDGYDYLLLDKDSPEKSVNLTALLGRRAASILLQDKKHNRLYVYDASGLLQTADVDTGALNVVSNRVRAFEPFGSDIVLCITDSTDENYKNVTYIQGEESYTLRTLPTGSRYLIGIADYDGSRYVAAGSDADSRVYIYENPRDFMRRKPNDALPVLALLKVAGQGQLVGFSTNTRFLAVQGGSAFAVYDFERNRQFRYDTKLSTEGLSTATWMDGHRLNVVSANKLAVFDFDGTNIQNLMSASKDFTPFFDRDYKVMLTVSPSLSKPDALALVRSELIVQ